MNNDDWLKLALTVLGAALGFVFSQVSDRLKMRREPKRRLSFDLNIGASMASVPKNLAERVNVYFGENPVKGQLFEAVCRVENTGNQVIKDQYLRFNFPDGYTVLDSYLQSPLTPEIGCEPAPPEVPSPSDFRWSIAHLEKGQSVSLGFLTVGDDPKAPQIFPYNEAGGVELVARGANLAEDDAEHIRPLLIILLVGWLLPNVPIFFGDLAGAVLRLALLVLAVPHIAPVARFITSRMRQAHADPTKESLASAASPIAGTIVEVNLPKTDRDQAQTSGTGSKGRRQGNGPAPGASGD